MPDQTLAWKLLGTLKGPKGDTGPKGEKGDPGSGGSGTGGAPDFTAISDHYEFIDLVSELGLDTTGKTDISTAVNKRLERSIGWADDAKTTVKAVQHYVILITSGTYLVDSPIFINSMDMIVPIGEVTFLNNGAQGNFIRNDSVGSDTIGKEIGNPTIIVYSDGRSDHFNYWTLISGAFGSFRIMGNLNGNRSSDYLDWNAVGAGIYLQPSYQWELQHPDETKWPSLNIEQTRFDNCVFEQLAYGCLLKQRDTYCLTWNHCHFNLNVVHVGEAPSSYTGGNFGEHLLFLDCNFSQGQWGVAFMSKKMNESYQLAGEYVFMGCRMDFVSSQIYNPQNYDWGKWGFAQNTNYWPPQYIGCHIEQTWFLNVSNGVFRSCTFLEGDSKWIQAATEYVDIDESCTLQGSGVFYMPWAQKRKASMPVMNFLGNRANTKKDTPDATVKSAFPTLNKVTIGATKKFNNTDYVACSFDADDSYMESFSLAGHVMPHGFVIDSQHDGDTAPKPTIGMTFADGETVTQTPTLNAGYQSVSVGYAHKSGVPYKYRIQLPKGSVLYIADVALQ